jgi:spore coat polysaccharide biosynthesis protein SpsF
MGSTRLPEKIFMELGGETVLAKVVHRTSRARNLDAVIVSTSSLPENDCVEALCRREGWNVFRGDEADVLTRYVETARAAEADVVVRITADCPLIDPELVDSHVEHALAVFSRADFVTNMVRETYPLGLAVEVMPRDVLERLDRLSDTPYLREHVTTLIYERPELFLVEHVLNATDRSSLRLTLDYAEDLELIRQIYDSFGHDRFSLGEVLDLLDRHPQWLDINRRHARPRP